PYVPRIGDEPAPMTDDYAEVVRDEGAWVAEQAGRLVGLLVLRPQLGHLLLQNVAVSPDVRKRGLGRLLLDLAERRARELGLAAVRQYTNVAMTAMVAYYARHGCHAAHRATLDGFHRAFVAKRVTTD